MSRPPTVLCLNNYDLSGYADISHSAPNHFLYGLNDLHRNGYRVLTGSLKERMLLKKVQVAVQSLIPLGDLSQQWAELTNAHRADVIYVPCDSVAQVLCYMNAIRVLRTPVVCLAHHPLLFGRLTGLRRPWVRLAIRGMASFPSLSRTVADQINAIQPGKSTVLPWGPDLDYYPAYAPPGQGVVSAGRTGRDFLTLGQAATGLTTPVTMICPASYVVQEFSGFGSNVRVEANPNPIHVTYQELIKYYSSAAAVAIPMLPSPSLCGLTSLLDAMAMGRAVLMTRNPMIDIDIEAENIGFWLSPGDTAGWRKALQYVTDHPVEIAAMGQRARRLAEDKYNSRAFGAAITNLIATVVGHGMRKL